MTNVIPINLETVDHHICKVHHSEEDRSVNFEFPNRQEARYVRRTDDYFIVYISSHGGCDRACRMCHLTQTGQTEMVSATVDEMFLQASVVLAHYVREVDTGKQPPAQKVHFNWMARGEPLKNDYLLDGWNELSSRLKLLARSSLMSFDAEIKFKISTTLPADTYGRNFVLQRMHAKNVLQAKIRKLMEHPIQPEIYYSLYSVKHDFRRRWLRKTIDGVDGIEVLARLRKEFDFDVVLHWAYIEGENDSEEDTLAIKRAIARFKLEAKFNLVRYNPYSPDQGKEPPEEVLQRNFIEIASVMKRPGSRIVPRVGYDVKASCGCFIETKG